jgi:hypothetical protein
VSHLCSIDILRPFRHSQLYCSLAQISTDIFSSNSQRTSSKPHQQSSAQYLLGAHLVEAAALRDFYKPLFGQNPIFGWSNWYSIVWNGCEWTFAMGFNGMAFDRWLLFWIQEFRSCHSSRWLIARRLIATQNFCYCIHICFYPPIYVFEAFGPPSVTACSIVIINMAMVSEKNHRSLKDYKKRAYAKRRTISPSTNKITGKNNTDYLRVTATQKK